MPEITRFVSLQELSAEAARVVRITTKSGSQYTVGLVGAGPQRSVVVRGRDKDGSKIEIQDPMGALENGRSLFSVPPHEWVGQGIDVGSLSTSRIAKVEEVTDVAEVTTFSGLRPKPPSAPAPQKEFSTAAETPAVPRSPVSWATASPAYVASSPKPAPRVSEPSPVAVPTTPPAEIRNFSAPTAPSPKQRAPVPAVPAAKVAGPPVASTLPRSAQSGSKPASPPLIVAEAPSGPLSLEPRQKALPDTRRAELEDRVLDLEYAAAYLNRLHRHRRVLEGLDHHPDLLNRFEDAFSLCTLTVEALSKSLLEDASS